MTDAAALQERYGTTGDAGCVTFEAGQGGLPRAVLRNGTAVAEVYIHGAHVSRWGVGGYEALWMSADAVYKTGKALRGGIPLCWPQFGPGQLPQHGFLRNSNLWSVDAALAGADGKISVTLAHSDNEATRAAWPHAFKVAYTVTLHPQGELTTKLDVANSGEAEFDFTTALHTYFNLPHIDAARMEGFAGLRYMDNLQARKEVEEMNTEPLHITAETDRIYLSTPNKLAITDGYHGRIVIDKSDSLCDAVLWNPWVGKATSMGDFNNYGWTSMVCIEAGKIGTPVKLAPGATWSGEQTMSVVIEKQW